MLINDNIFWLQEFVVVDFGLNSFYMVIVCVVDGVMQIIGCLKQCVYLVDGFDENLVLSEEVMICGLNCLLLFVECLQGFFFFSVCIVGMYMLCQVINVVEFFKCVEKVIFYLIEIIFGNEEVCLIFMGVEYMQLECGCKLVIDIGGGLIELVIGEDFEFCLVESCCMGCVSFLQVYFSGGVINKENFQCVCLVVVQKLEMLVWQFCIQGWIVVLGVFGIIKVVQEVLVVMGEKDGFIMLECFEMLVNELLKYKNFDVFSLFGFLEDCKVVFVSGLVIFCGVFDVLVIKEFCLFDGVLCEGVLYEMEGCFCYQDICSCMVQSLVNQYNIDCEQVCWVLEIIIQMLEQWQEQNFKLVNLYFVVLLKWVVMFYEVGLNINYSGMYCYLVYIF